MMPSPSPIEAPYGPLYGASVRDDKVFTVRESGSVRLYGPEFEVLQTAAFQRLDGIRQLGTAHFVFRSAKHTRFEHALGTLHEAEELVQRVNRNPDTYETFDSDAHVLTRLAALVHDITHIPFGHTIEDELGLLTRHDVNGPRLNRLLDGPFGDALRRAAGDLFDELIHVLDAIAGVRDVTSLRYPFVADVVGNTVCADMLDYVQRDMRGCGLPYALGDRFLDFFIITPPDPVERELGRRMALALDRRGMPRPDVESDVVKLLTYRYELTDRVYFHHSKNAGSVMLGRALRAAGFVGDGPSDSDDAPFDRMRDERLIDCLRDPAYGAACGFPASGPKRRLATELSEGLLNRKFYKARWVGVHDDIGDRAERWWTLYQDPVNREEQEDQLASAGGLEPGQVLLHVPPHAMMLKAAKVLVKTSAGKVETLKEWDARHSGRTIALNDAHERLWRMAVYVHPEATEAQWRLVRSAAADLFDADSRYEPGARNSRWARTLADQEAVREGWTVHERDVALTAAAENRESQDYYRGAEEMRAKVEADRAANDESP